MQTYILDSWPLLERELRGVTISLMEELMSRAASGDVRLLMSELNLGEVFYLLAKKRGESNAEAWLALAKQLPVDVISVTPEQLWSAARLKARTTLSFADCFCAVLAQLENGRVVTGDPDFLPLAASGALQVEWLGA